MLITSNKPRFNLKLMFTLLLIIIVLSSSLFIVYPRSLYAVTGLRTNQIVLQNTVHEAKSVTISDQNTVTQILDLLESTSYSRRFMLTKPLQTIYGLKLMDLDSKESYNYIFINEELVQINNDFYRIKDRAMARNIITVLAKKGFTHQAEIGY